MLAELELKQQPPTNLEIEKMRYQRLKQIIIGRIAGVIWNCPINGSSTPRELFRLDPNGGSVDGNTLDRNRVREIGMKIMNDYGIVPERPLRETDTVSSDQSGKVFREEKDFNGRYVSGLVFKKVTEGKILGNNERTDEYVIWYAKMRNTPKATI